MLMAEKERMKALEILTHMREIAELGQRIDPEYWTERLKWIEEQIKKEKELIKGKSGSNHDDWWKLGADDLEKRREVDANTRKILFNITLKYLKEDLRSYKIIDSSTSTDPFARDCRICVSPHMAWAVPGAEETASGREKVIYLNPDWLNSLDEKFRAFLLAHEKCHIEKRECVADQACATLCALKNLDVSEKEKTDLARRWYSFWAKDGLYGDEKYITPLRKLLSE